MSHTKFDMFTIPKLEVGRKTQNGWTNELNVFDTKLSAHPLVRRVGMANL
jgi:hypothetical protein